MSHSIDKGSQIAKDGFRNEDEVVWKITMQRKGGDGGRITANMLQFKINPAELFEI